LTLCWWWHSEGSIPLIDIGSIKIDRAILDGRTAALAR
jgi:hypothetical protein